MNERDGWIGAALATLRGDRSQKAIADDMRFKGHRWSQATVWSVEKGERRLLLSEAEDLATVVGCEVMDLLKPPSELGYEYDIARACASIREAYEDLVWHASELLAAHDNLREEVSAAEREGVAYSVRTDRRIKLARALTVEAALAEAELLNQQLAEGGRVPLTREEFDAQRRRAGDDGEHL